MTCQKYCLSAACSYGHSSGHDHKRSNLEELHVAHQQSCAGGRSVNALWVIEIVFLGAQRIASSFGLLLVFTS